MNGHPCWSKRLGRHVRVVVPQRHELEARAVRGDFSIAVSRPLASCQRAGAAPRRTGRAARRRRTGCRWPAPCGTAPRSPGPGCPPAPAAGPRFPAPGARRGCRRSLRIAASIFVVMGFCWPAASGRPGSAACPPATGWAPPRGRDAPVLVAGLEQQVHQPREHRDALHARELRVGARAVRVDRLVDFRVVHAQVLARVLQSTSAPPARRSFSYCVKLARKQWPPAPAAPRIELDG
jgi:hypothetical protein